jgi:EPS-associated MarR family transcriptional regulator
LKVSEENILKVLKLTDKVTTQKEISNEIGCSVGKVNYILKALIEKGYIKAERFFNSKDKYKYKYILTRDGFKEKISITEKFIQRKKEEYEILQKDLKEYKKKEF